MESVSLWRSLQIQSRVVRALLMREVLTRFGRHNLGFLWLFLEPMLFTVGIAILWTAMKATHGHTSMPIVGFAVTGYSSVLLWRNMPARCIHAIEPNRTLMHHRNVRPMDIYLARILLEVVGVTTSFVVLSLVFAAIGMLSLPEHVPLVAAGWLLLAWFGTAFGIFLAGIAERSEVVDKIWHPMSYLLFPMSGAAFMVDWLPPGIQQWVLWLPMVHGVELIREGYFGSLVRTHYDVTYLIGVSMALTFAGLLMMRDSGRREFA